MQRETLRINVVYSPQFEHGRKYAEQFARQFERLGAGRERAPSGICVRVRCVEAPEADSPKGIDWDLAEFHVVILLSEKSLRQRLAKTWREPFFSEVIERAKGADANVLVVNVAMTRAGLDIREVRDTQAERFFSYRNDYSPALADGGPNQPMRRLLLNMMSLIGAFLTQKLRSPGSLGPAVGETQGPIKVFISHTSRSGRKLAEDIHARLVGLSRYGFEPFLDVHALTPGRNYIRQFESTISTGVFLAIQTDDYATRRFCRWEMLTAKRHRRPILVAQMLVEGESRSFPYAGNTVLRTLRSTRARGDTPARRGAWWFGGQSAAGVSGDEAKEIDSLLLSLLAETLRSLVFLHDAGRAAMELGIEPAECLARPPELADLAALHGRRQDLLTRGATTIVYPDPPLDEAEITMIDELAAPLQAMTLSEFRAGFRPAPRTIATGTPRPLHGKRLGVSVGEVEAAELLRLGLVVCGDGRCDAMNQALAQIVTVFAQLGATIGYGGDLRSEQSFTRQLFDEVADAYRALELEGTRLFVNYLAWSAWRQMPAAAVFEHIKRMELLGGVQLFLADGSCAALTWDEDDDGAPLLNLEHDLPGAGELEIRNAAGFQPIYDLATFDPTGVGAALTSMRRRMAQDEDGRIIIGGKTRGHTGRCPGVAEEAIETLKQDKLLLVCGAFGGAARDVGIALGLADDVPQRPLAEKGVGYSEAMTELAALSSAHARILERHGITRDMAALLNAADNPSAIAELVRRMIGSAL